MSDLAVLIAKHVIKLQVFFSDLGLFFERKEKESVKSWKWFSVRKDRIDIWSATQLLCNPWSGL